MNPVDFKAMMRSANTSADSGGQFEQLPFGSYTVALEKCWRNQSKKTQRNQVSFVGKVMEGENEGRSAMWHYSLDHEVSLSIFINQLRCLEVDTYSIASMESFDELCTILTERKPVMLVKIFKGKGEFINTKIEQLLGWQVGDESPAPAPEPAPEPLKPAPVPPVTVTKPMAVKVAPVVKAAPPPPPPPPVAAVPAEPAEEESTELKVGMKLRFLFQNKEVVGEVKELVGEDDIRVLCDGKMLSIKPEEIIGLAE